MIDKSTIESVKNIPIEQVIARFIKIEKKGTTYTSLCPFHNEKTGSFIIFPRRNNYHCFGCGAHGDLITFVQQYLGLSFIDAIEHIAKDFSISIIKKQPSEQDIQREKEKQNIISLYRFAIEWYVKNLISNQEAMYYAQSRMQTDSIHLWQLGYAPNQYNSFYTAAISKGYDNTILLRSNLIKIDPENGKYYDFFRNRLIFPINDTTGTPISFAGRAIDSNEKIKYINLPESDYYKKRNVLFGFDQAYREISRTKKAFVTEGYIDVIRLHELGIHNVVASSGTAFTTDHLTSIKRLADTIIFMQDGDDAGTKAMINAGRLAMSASNNIYVVPMPEGKDPGDAWQNQEEAYGYIEKNTSDFLNWYANYLFKNTEFDPLKKNNAIETVVDILMLMPVSMRSLYIQDLAKKYKIKTKIIEDKIKERDHEETTTEERDITVPEGASQEMFDKYGFYAYKNEYYFRTQKGIEKLSNFVMRPLFHVKSYVNGKRVYELINRNGSRVVEQFDMNEMTSVQGFQKKVESHGNFLFWGQISNFNRIKLMLYEETRSCEEINVPGWQREGFWAWSNGIIDTSGLWIEIDEYGIVTHNGNNYFLPAFSNIYINDKSLFTAERKFRFINSNVDFNEWCKLFTEVYGDNAKIAIAYWVAATFRDFILRIFKNFPILNLFGPPATGKSQMSRSISYLYGEDLTPFNINNGTKAGLAEHLQQFSNAVVWIDEYKNALDREIIETLKSIYDSIGRSRLNIELKKQTTQVNSAVILSGQEMPTADIALFERLIFIMFSKEKFSVEEKARYDSLIDMQKKGLSHFTSKLISGREHFEKKFYIHYTEVLEQLNSCFENNQIKDRILRNMATIMAAFKTMENHLPFSFSYNQLLPIAIEKIEYQNAQITHSNEIGIFWSIIEALFDENLVINEWHYRIDYSTHITTKTSTITFDQPKNVLKFKYNAIYSLYAQHARKQGIKPLPIDTLQYYLKTNMAFIAIQKQCFFTLKEYNRNTMTVETQTQNTSAMCFDYDKLNINIQRDITNSAPNEYINGMTTNKPTEVKSSSYYEKQTDIPF